MVLDIASRHRAKFMGTTELTSLPLPSYSPERSPAEQNFQVLRANLSNQVFATPEELEETLTAQRPGFWDQSGRLCQLTAYPGWRQGVETPMLVPL